METEPQQTEPLGILAEFDDAHAIVRAAQRTHEEGYRRVEGYSPFPLEDLSDALGFRRTWLPLIVLIGGILGGCGGFALQYWVSKIQYPLNIGGRPLNSWPMFIPVTFECVVLAASLFCVLGMLALNGLPRPHHPLFDVEGFDRASSDRFFLFVQARDKMFDPQQTRDFLQTLHPLRVIDVPKVG